MNKEEIRSLRSKTLKHISKWWVLHRHLDKEELWSFFNTTPFFLTSEEWGPEIKFPLPYYTLDCIFILIKKSFPIITNQIVIHELQRKFQQTY